MRMDNPEGRWINPQHLHVLSATRWGKRHRSSQNPGLRPRAPLGETLAPELILHVGIRGNK